MRYFRYSCFLEWHSRSWIWFPEFCRISWHQHLLCCIFLKKNNRRALENHLLWFCRVRNKWWPLQILCVYLRKDYPHLLPGPLYRVPFLRIFHPLPNRALRLYWWCPTSGVGRLVRPCCLDWWWKQIWPDHRLLTPCHLRTCGSVWSAGTAAQWTPGSWASRNLFGWILCLNRLCTSSLLCRAHLCADS